jgi:hypothetical protein
MALPLVGCSPQSYAAADPSVDHVGIVFDIGGKDDRSFNAAAWNGVKCAQSGRWPTGPIAASRRLVIPASRRRAGNPR